MLRALVTLSLVFAACSPCQTQCERIREQLVRDFGVDASTLRSCSDPAWISANTCEKCQAMLARDFSVKLTTCEAAPLTPVVPAELGSPDAGSSGP